MVQGYSCRCLGAHLMISSTLRIISAASVADNSTCCLTCNTTYTLANTLLWFGLNHVDSNTFQQQSAFPQHVREGGGIATRDPCQSCLEADLEGFEDAQLRHVSHSACQHVYSTLACILVGSMRGPELGDQVGRVQPCTLQASQPTTEECQPSTFWRDGVSKTMPGMSNIETPAVAPALAEACRYPGLTAGNSSRLSKLPALQSFD